MAKDKDMNKYKKDIKNPELLIQEKDTQQERKERGSRGNVAQENWAAHEKERQESAKNRPNIDSRIRERKEQNKEVVKENKDLDKAKDQNKEKGNDKDR